MSGETPGRSWPHGMPAVGGRAERTRRVAAEDITRLRTTVTRGDGVVALEGTALCYTVPL